MDEPHDGTLASRYEHETEANVSIIASAEYEALRAEIAKLRAVLSALMQEHDHLLHVECANIETAYILAFGDLIYKLDEAENQCLRMKRKVELAQSMRNRQEEIVTEGIDAELDVEFEAYQSKLDEQLEKMNEAMKRSHDKQPSMDEEEELRTLYRKIVKALHPDLNPNVSEEQIKLFAKAVEAYRKGDLATLRMIADRIGSENADLDTDTLLQLTKERNRLRAMIAKVRREIRAIKSKYPYRVKALVNDPAKVAKHRAKLEYLIQQFNDAAKLWKAKWDEMMNE